MHMHAHHLDRVDIDAVAELRGEVAAADAGADDDVVKVQRLPLGRADARLAAVEGLTLELARRVAEAHVDAALPY